MEYIEKRNEERKFWKELHTKEYLEHKEQMTDLSKGILISHAYEKQVIEESNENSGIIIDA